MPASMSSPGATFRGLAMGTWRAAHSSTGRQVASPFPVVSCALPVPAHSCSWSGTEHLLRRRHGLLLDRPQRLWHLLLRELVRLRRRPPQGGGMLARDHAMRLRAGRRLLPQWHGLLARRLPGKPAAAFGDRRLVDAGRHGDVGSDGQCDIQTRRSGSSKRRCSLGCYAAWYHSCRVGCSVGGGRPSVSAETDSSTRLPRVSAIELNAEGPR